MNKDITKRKKNMIIQITVTADVDARIDRGDFFLHYKIYGKEGPFIVMLSGGPGAEVIGLQPMTDVLKSNYRVVMLEQRGTGRSTLKKYDTSNIAWKFYLEDLEALRRDLKVDKFALLGNSWGMMLALSYAIAYPENTSAVVTVGSGVTTQAYLQVFYDNEHARLSPDMQRRMDEIDKKIQQNPVLAKKLEKEKLALSLPAYFFHQENAEKFFPMLGGINLEVSSLFHSSNFERIDLLAQFGKITAPTLLIQGRQDLASDQLILETHQRIKNSTLKIIEQCGHFPWFEQPEQTMTAIMGFLRKVLH